MTTDISSDDDFFAAIAMAVNCEIGEGFLRRSVEVLQRFMDSSLAMIAVADSDDPNRVRAVYALRDDQVVGDLAYDLTGTPCSLVYSADHSMVVPCDLAARFPRERAFESYLGAPLHDLEGRVIGHLAIFGRSEVRGEEQVKPVLAVLAQRAEAELRRLAFERERDRLVADLQRQTERLQVREQTIRNQNAFKTRLLGIIAHDLRNPIAAIMSQSELAAAHLQKSAPAIEKVARSNQKIMQNADRMSALIDATLDRVRAEDANLTLTRTDCDVAGLVTQAVEVNQTSAARKSITLEADLSHAGQVTADEELLLRAIDNLINNAVKYTQPGGHVRVEAAPDAAGLRIRVCDNGQGLDAEDLRRAFHRFETLSARPTGGESSTGLGLANVREIVEAHGGTITADSPGRGQGAVFAIYLPHGL